MDELKDKKRKKPSTETTEFEKWASPSYPFLCQQLAGLLQVLRRLVPDVGMVAEHQQALLVGKHHCNHREQQSLDQISIVRTNVNFRVYG